MVYFVFVLFVEYKVADLLIKARDLVSTLSHNGMICPFMCSYTVYTVYFFVTSKDKYQHNTVYRKFNLLNKP